jgi:uncharacterized membrane protein YbhN (UPF0104 family)
LNRQRLRKILPPAFGLVVLAGIVVGLRGALREVRPSAVFAALAATPGTQVLHAVLLLLCSIGIMLIYDIPGYLFARRLPEMPRLGPAQIGLASFCAYALSHVVGAAAISAAAIRVRLYAQWQVPVAGITRIVAISGTMFSLGLVSLVGLLLLIFPGEVPLFGAALAMPALRGIGAALVFAILLYITAAQLRPQLTLFGRRFASPGQRLALAQIVISCCDTGTACAILYAVLPAAPGLGYPTMLGIYLAAFAGGVLSGLPGGVGVFDSVLLLGLSNYLPADAALGAILLFRALYFLAPAAAAAMSYAAHEVFLTSRRRRGAK